MVSHRSSGNRIGKALRIKRTLPERYIGRCIVHRWIYCGYVVFDLFPVLKSKLEGG